MNYKLLALFLVGVIVFAGGCTGVSGAPMPTAILNEPIVLGAGVAHQENLSVRLDYVRILEADGDAIGSNEVYFAILVVRPDQPPPMNSAKLIMPGDGTLHGVNNGDIVKLGGFGIQLENVEPDEIIHVFFLGIDEDENNPQRQLAEGAFQVTLDLLSGAVPAGGLVKFMLSQTIGQAGDKVLDWWREADVIGEYAFTVKGTDHPLIGKQSRVSSNNGNLEFYFSLIPNTEHNSISVPPSDTDTVNFVIENKSQSTITRIFIVPEDSSTLDSGIEVNIGPNSSESFVIPRGIYKIRLSSEQHTSWEDIIAISDNLTVPIRLLTSE